MPNFITLALNPRDILLSTRINPDLTALVLLFPTHFSPSPPHPTCRRHRPRIVIHPCIVHPPMVNPRKFHPYIFHPRMSHPRVVHPRIHPSLVYPRKGHRRIIHPVFHPRVVHPHMSLFYPSKRFTSGLDSAYLTEHRGRSTPSPSIWTRLVQWVPDFGFTGAAGVAVPVDDLRPRAKHVQITLDAVDDIRFCETLFVGWMTELNKCVANRLPWPHVPSHDNNELPESRATPSSKTDERNT